MRHRGSAVCLMIVFLIGTTGINVHRAFCFCCREYTSQFQWLALEEKTTCPHACDCCHTCSDHETHHEDFPSEHGFFKITDNWLSPEEEVLPQLAALLVPGADRVEPVICEYEYAPFKFLPLCTDCSPPPEWLCTFRC